MMGAQWFSSVFVHMVAAQLKIQASVTCMKNTRREIFRLYNRLNYSTATEDFICFSYFLQLHDSSSDHLNCFLHSSCLHSQQISVQESPFRMWQSRKFPAWKFKRSTMDPESCRTIQVAALGRPFALGMLYDCRRDLLIPGLSLWDSSDLEERIRKRPQNYNNFEIVASESIEDKSSALDVEASLKASFLGGLIQVDGSAKYLNNSKTSKNQARVTLKYKATTKVKELSMDHLGRGNVRHPYVFNEGVATHVVTAVLYGAQAFFVFDREVSQQEDHQDIEGNLKVMIKKIPGFAMEGEGSLKMEDKDKANVDKFSCSFFGDFNLQKMPTSYQEAIQVYQSLPQLLGTNGENAVPMKVWLLPLTTLDSSAAKLVRQISVGLVQESQRVLEDFNELELRCNDALKTTTAQQFPQIGKKIKTIKDMCYEFKLDFQEKLAKKLPSIRGGGEEEGVLAEILKKRHSSPFSTENLNEWMDCKEKETQLLTSITNLLKNTKVVSAQSVNEEIFSAEHLLCFVFTSLGDDEPFLSDLSNYLRQTPEQENTQDLRTHDVEKEQWFTSREVAKSMKTKAKLFSDFAEANLENSKIKFLTVGMTNQNQKGSSIYLYEDGFPVSENFEPPSRPKAVTVGDVSHNSVTLKIDPPQFGSENITSYSVEFCVRGEEQWKQQETSKPEEVTVGDLSPDTEYMFRCRAVTSVGVGPANQVSSHVKTLAWNPPGKLQVESNSSEISVSWEKPAEIGGNVSDLSYIVEYAKTDERADTEEDLQWSQKMTKTEQAVISGLQQETEYAVRVRCDYGSAGRSKESITVKVCTTKNIPPKDSHNTKIIRNLLKNPSGKEQLKFWDLTENGGDEWKVDDMPGDWGFNRYPRGESKFFATSYRLCLKRQVIDLLAEGYSEEHLDAQPAITVKDWYSGRRDCGCTYQVTVCLLDNNAEVMQKFEPEMVTLNPDCDDGSWKQISRTFSNYGPGMRFISFEHGGQDTKFWAGWFGVRVTGSSVTVEV